MSVNFQKMEFFRSCTSVNDTPRDGLAQIVFAGRSNVGKSSVLNELAIRKNLARVGSAPGKTTHINFFCVDKKFYLVDLPGYGYAKVSQSEKLRWARLLENYFAAEQMITGGILVVDARHKPTEQDVQMANLFESRGMPWVVVANKIDKLKPSQREAALSLIYETLDTEKPLIAFSSQSHTGRSELIGAIEGFL